MASLPSGTVTFLFTDIEGSTELVRALREQWADVVADHRRLLRVAFAESEGQEVDTQGDSFFVAFARARDAVRAAVSAQRALAAHDWPHGAELRVRMGIHTGEPQVGDEGYLGLDVARAARIASAAHGGQVLVSESTRALLAEEGQLRDLGAHTLKDFGEVRLYQVVADGLPADFPPPRGSTSKELVLPGREQELATRAERMVEGFTESIQRSVSESLRRAGIDPGTSFREPTQRSLPVLDRPAETRELVFAGVMATIVIVAFLATVAILLLKLL
jgi:class 3 adenylate cyclase